jgi:hypothetical protein
MKDPTDHPIWKRFEAHVRNDLIPKMKASASVLLIAPDISTPFDVQFAVQIGASVLLEKPLVLIVEGNRTVPPKLERVADRIIRADLSTERGMAAVDEEIARFMTDYGRQ